MMKAVVAVYADWGIGCGGTQPVVVKEDRRHFRELTGTGAVIVGRRTLADFPGGRPLKNRVNIVLTRSALAVEGAVVVHSVGEALTAAAQQEQVFVIGGESVYRCLFPYIDCVYVTKIDAAPRSDAFFPRLDSLSDWHITDPGIPLESDGISYRFQTYERIQK